MRIMSTFVAGAVLGVALVGTPPAMWAADEDPTPDTPPPGATAPPGGTRGPSATPQPGAHQRPSGAYDRPAGKYTVVPQQGTATGGPPSGGARDTVDPRIGAGMPGVGATPTTPSAPPQ